MQDAVAGLQAFFELDDRRIEVLPVADAAGENQNLERVACLLKSLLHFFKTRFV